MCGQRQGLGSSGLLPVSLTGPHCRLGLWWWGRGGRVLAASRGPSVWAPVSLEVQEPCMCAGEWGARERGGRSIALTGLGERWGVL